MSEKLKRIEDLENLQDVIPQNSVESAENNEFEACIEPSDCQQLPFLVAASRKLFIIF